MREGDGAPRLTPLHQAWLRWVGLRGAAGEPCILWVWGGLKGRSSGRDANQREWPCSGQGQSSVGRRLLKQDGAKCRGAGQQAPSKLQWEPGERGWLRISAGSLCA